MRYNCKKNYILRNFLDPDFFLLLVSDISFVLSFVFISKKLGLLLNYPEDVLIGHLSREHSASLCPAM